MIERVEQRINASEIDLGKEPFILDTEIKDLLLIRRPRYQDDRGAFQEHVRIPDIEERICRKVKILQEQHSYTRPGVLRGIHAEPQDKIITPLTGRMVSVVVDLRVESDTFGEWIMIKFDNNFETNQTTTLFVPEGMGNSFCVFTKDGDTGNGTVIYNYAVTGVYNSKEAGMGIRYDDPKLAISWPIPSPQVSERDLNLPSFDEFVRKYRK